MKFYKKAFSAFEISIVLSIVALLVAATIQANNLATKGRIASVKSLTENSVVNSMDGLVGWWETSLPSSFGSLEWQDGDSIAVWYDRSRENLVKNNATQPTSANQPKIYSNVFNKVIPALRFDGSNDYFNFDGSGLIRSGYSIFIVEQRRSNKNANYIIAGSGNGFYTNLHIGYRSNAQFTQAHFGEDLNITVPGYSSPIPAIHNLCFDNSNGKQYYRNKFTSPTAIHAGINTISQFPNSRIGAYDLSYFFNGDLAEIIIFKRKLIKGERMAVMRYLSKKYDIPLS